jgi:phosphoribosyl isomerase A
MKTLELYPAVDIKQGKAARLTKGQADSAENFGDPAEIIQLFKAAGSKWIHLVDLDAAFNVGLNRELILKITQAIDINFQLSGGIKDQISLEFAVATNAKKINLAASAILDIKWLAQVFKIYGDRLSISLDVDAKTNQLIARGSGENLGNLFELITELDRIGCRRYILTDIARDGALTGPNLDLLQLVRQATSCEIIASGGVSSIADLKTLRSMEISGVVLGKALYNGQIQLSSAISACY